MKKTIRDILILCIQFTGVAWLYRRLRCGSYPRVRVIAFHDVLDGSWFSGIITHLMDDYHVLTPEEFERRDFQKDRTNILITFDDGYASWVTTVLPVLRAHAIRGIFFTNSGLLAAAEAPDQGAAFVRERLMVGERVVLTKEGAVELAQAGQYIGGHTAYHTRLSERDSEEVFQEVSEDKAFLERSLGITMNHFAYPFGTYRDYSDMTHRGVRSTGYTYLYSAEPGFFREGEAVIPRTLIETGQSYESITRWLSGAYDVFSLLKRHVMGYSA